MRAPRAAWGQPTGPDAIRLPTEDAWFNLVRMAKAPRSPGLRLRLVFDNGTWIGPGKVDLLNGIQETGSIAAAGRRLGMSYKRAWMLVETLNQMFADPLVESSRGGAKHGGARLTATGERVLTIALRLEAHAQAACAEEIADLEGLLADTAPAEAAHDR